jgi:predicted metal-dependent phosphoesterase TrpH
MDVVPYSTRELIDCAADRGLDALAVTLHERQRDMDDLCDHASTRGIVLVPGVERTIHGKHVLLLNYPREAESIESFAQLAELRARHPEGLVVAPHPFFHLAPCLGPLLERHADLFDAVEVNAFYTARFNFNRAAVRWARAHGKALVGNSDAHRLSIVGKTFSLIDAEPHPDAICAAIKAGRTVVQTRPLSVIQAATYFAGLTLSGLRPRQSERRSPVAGAHGDRLGAALSPRFE